MVVTMSPRLRKFALTVHVAPSVGWLGAVAGSLALAIAGLISEDAQVVRAAYLAMNSIGEGVLVPLALASLVTGLVLSLGTEWGLFRHYWVLIKLLINVFATVVLLLYMQTLGYLAGLAADPSVDLDALRDPSPVLHAGGALLVLLVATTLSVYKPRGMTRYGWRKRDEQRCKRHVGGPGIRYTEGL
jgi:SNF family Na+-dependent transporter